MKPFPRLGTVSQLSDGNILPPALLGHQVVTDIYVRIPEYRREFLVARARGPGCRRNS